MSDKIFNQVVQQARMHQQIHLGKAIETFVEAKRHLQAAKDSLNAASISCDIVDNLFLDQVKVKIDHLMNNLSISLLRATGIVDVVTEKPVEAKLIEESDLPPNCSINNGFVNNEGCQGCEDNNY
jgi:hypothetical protein